ncbi:hypothetical protein [Halomonas sp. M20]|uniref:hypothetical protein n=1 Tax=Halomonas sp. M20 TaxID=2763264 RepID=UPI001D0A045E|nr:hypothetical protein [Halomonas sp. M20]
MRAPKSVNALEELGRVRLSRSFFMRDFLYSEIANFYGEPNIPESPDLAIEVGKQLCTQLLEPLNATFGRIAIRSAYRSPTINALGNEKGHSCASNASNYAGHIWDHLDENGCKGATACIVIPWFADRYTHQGADWRALAYWIHDHLPYSALQFFPKLAAFNISWHERPKRAIHSYIEPKGYLLRGETGKSGFADLYTGFPELRD